MAGTLPSQASSNPLEQGAEGESLLLDIQASRLKMGHVEYIIYQPVQVVTDIVHIFEDLLLLPAIESHVRAKECLDIPLDGCGRSA